MPWMLWERLGRGTRMKSDKQLNAKELCFIRMLLNEEYKVFNQIPERKEMIGNLLMKIDQILEKR